ncbi:MAG: restriction endonuclease [Propionibacteriales bacterium]|nr:restriction endonuclease [Propionibacteriales bacterium]
MLEGLAPGDRLPRREVHARFGGRQQGGIGPSRTSPVVLFFTDPATGHQHGYYDGWDDDGLFNYVGEGQRGDQRLAQGNKAILQHIEDGRTLEGFLADGPMVTYLGEFVLADHYFSEAHESGDPMSLRQVVVFRLRAVGDLPADLPIPTVPMTPRANSRVDVVPVEERHTERAFVAPDRKPYEAERREAELVHDYRSHLLRMGHEVGRLRVVPPGESAPLYSDLWDETTRTLIEAKGGVTREQIRSAVGQLLDYGRFVENKALAVLVPSEPRADLIAYLSKLNIRLVYPLGERWD